MQNNKLKGQKEQKKKQNWSAKEWLHCGFSAAMYIIVYVIGCCSKLSILIWHENELKYTAEVNQTTQFCSVFLPMLLNRALRSFPPQIMSRWKQSRRFKGLKPKYTKLCVYFFRFTFSNRCQWFRCWENLFWRRMVISTAGIFQFFISAYANSQLKHRSIWRSIICTGLKWVRDIMPLFGYEMLISDLNQILKYF